MPRPVDSASPSSEVSAAVRFTPGTLANRAALVLALGALAVVTFDYPSASRIHGWPWAAITTALWLLPVSALLIGIPWQAVWRTPSPALLGGSLLLAAGAFLSALLSPFSAASLPRIWPTLGGVALFLWLHHEWSAPGASNENRHRWIGRGLAVAGILFTAVSLYQWSGGSWPLPWDARNNAPFGHSTYTAGAAVLFLPWLLLQVWSAHGRARIGWLASVGAALVVLIGTSSRGGVIAFAFTGFIGVLAAAFQSRWSGPRKLGVALVLLVVGAAAVLTNPRLRDLVLHRRWSDTARESNAQRQAMLAAGLHLGAERPWVGWGPGSVPLAYPRVRALLDGGAENVLQLHNTPAQIWATTGIVGALALMLLVGGTLTAIARTVHSPVTLAASASLVGYGVVALTDHQVDLPIFAVMLATDLAALTASGFQTRRTISPTPITRGIAGLLLFAATVVGLGATLRDLQARWHYDAALTALGAGRSQEFLEALDRASHAAPNDPFFQHQAAAWLLDLRGTVRDPARQAVLTRDAASRLKRSLAAGIHEEFAHFNLGWLELDLDRPQEAARHFTAVARLVPDKGGVYFGLGLAHLAAGSRDAAIRAFALEAINDPRSITSPAWELPRLAALQPAIRTEVIRLYATLRQQYAASAQVGAWTRWWWGETVPVADLRPTFGVESARFLGALAVIEAGEPLPATDALWSTAYTAWRTSHSSPAATEPAVFLRTASGDRRFAEALARRSDRHRDNFRSFLSAPTEDEPALLRTLRHRRSGYGVLALHPEGPPLHDVYIVQENRVATDLAAELFPAKGWLPGRFLLALLPESPR